MRTILVVSLFSAATFAGAPAIVEHVTEAPKPGVGLGTGSYSVSSGEEPFFKKLVRGEFKTGGMMTEYDITTKNGVYVGWFGVVRAVKEEKGETLLVVEHKGFDGLTDRHILALDFNGSGDFAVRIPGVGHKIERLTLVKVYGTATVAKGPPEVKAEFVRNWHWGTFTFIMAAGKQRGSEAWRKLNTVNLNDIYDPYPKDGYYEARLGKR